MASMDAAKVVPTSILNVRPVIWLRQSAIAPPALVILPVSPEGTKVITIGLSAEPRAPAAGAAGASGSLLQTGGGGAVFVAGAAVGASVAVAASVGACVGASVAVGACVGAWVAAGGCVGAGVAGAQAETTSTSTAITANNRCSDFFIFLLLVQRF